MTMAAIAPAAMLFVRNEKGISHSPLENMSEADAGIAIKVLLETIWNLPDGRSRRIPAATPRTIPRRVRKP